MQPVLLTTFLEVVAWIVIVFFWALAIWVFISVFADIFRRRDLSGIAKALWILFIFVLPLLGALIYIIVRPPMATYEQDMELIEAQRRAMGATAASEIEKANELLKAGAITQAEYDQIKARALG